MSDEDKIVVVDNVSVKFNMASERIDSMKDYVIKRIKGVISYNEFYALNNISFDMDKGGSIGLIGLNGSGKSTLLKTVAGVLKPQSGEAKVNGTIAPLIELGAGFDLELTARENIYLNGALLGFDRETMAGLYDSIVEFSELNEFIDVPVKNYSSGMMARLGFAIATAGQPDLLIVDETLSVGDFMFQFKCLHRIKQMIANGSSLLFVSHSIEQVEEVCKRCIWLEKGKIVKDGPTKDITKLYKEAY